MTEQLSAVQARRIALAAQGLAQPRAPTVDAAALHAMARRLGVIQLDSVNVLTRSHYLPAWSRLGAYKPDALDELSRTAPRALFEYWGHEASLLPVELQPLFRWRMEQAAHKAWGNVRAMQKKRALLDEVLAFIRERGPIGVADLELETPAKARQSGGWWGWSDGKRALEWLFWSGQITSAGRRRFERLYDLPERVLPQSVLATATPSEADAHRRLVEVAARAMGLASEADLRDYFRLPLLGARRAVAELVESGALRKLAVEGWKKPGYLHRDAVVPTEAGAAGAADRMALLSPFDSLIWTRDRTERLFGMRVRLEVYVPAPKRVHGYYVLPFLLGEQLVGRVDLKADREAGALLVQSAHLEDGKPRAEVAAALASELRALAAWQGLERVQVVKRGGLAMALAGELKPTGKKPAAKRPATAKKSAAAAKESATKPPAAPKRPAAKRR